MKAAQVRRKGMGKGKVLGTGCCIDKGLANGHAYGMGVWVRVRVLEGRNSKNRCDKCLMRSMSLRLSLSGSTVREGSAQATTPHCACACATF